MKIKSYDDHPNAGGDPANLGAALAMPLTSAIHSISSMFLHDASWEDIALAAAKCSVTMLPGCSSLVLDVQSDSASAAVIASLNAPFVARNEALSIDAGSIIEKALKQPDLCHHGDQAEINSLFPRYQNSLVDSDNLMVLKVVARSGALPNILVVVVGASLEVEAETALLALAELLHALSVARETLDADTQKRLAIVRAKNEWEATVDVLDALVCLIDNQDRILRVNRTVERWHIGSVENSRGMTLHELLHPMCVSTSCELRAAFDSERLKQSQQELTVNDERLERVLLIKVQSLTDVADNIDFLPDDSIVVVISDVTALHNAKSDLRTLNKELEEKVAERTGALRNANEALNREIQVRSEIEADLKSSRDELARLSGQLMNAHEDERSRLSRELHDSVGQSLSAVKYTIERLAAGQGKMNESEAQGILANAVDGVTGAIREMRSIAMQLRPPALDEMGVTAALQWLLQNFSSTYPDIEFRSEITVSADEVASGLSTPIYRITQEALNNVVKHAAAGLVRTSLRRESAMLILEIVDDGSGFDADLTSTGQFQMQGNFGRLGMRERASNSGGLLTLTSTRGNGTSVLVEWALDADEKVEE